ncbi:hypothetical protein LZ30DRAFT_592076, partial [Colletotrichum cereale]
LAYPPSPRTTQRWSPAALRPSPQPPQQSHRHQQAPQITRGQRASIPYRLSRTATPPSTPPSTDQPSQPTVLKSSTGSPQATDININTYVSRNAREERDSRHPQQRSEPTRPEVQAKEVIDGAELLGTILDGIGRMAVGTVAMRMDEAGRWRIRRDSGGESA